VYNFPTVITALKPFCTSNIISIKRLQSSS